jgi:hypothetical protein
MLRVIMLHVIMLRVVMLSGIVLRVVMLSFVMVSDNKLCVAILRAILQLSGLHRVIRLSVMAPQNNLAQTFNRYLKCHFRKNALIDAAN